MSWHKVQIDKIVNIYDWLQQMQLYQNFGKLQHGLLNQSHIVVFKRPHLDMTFFQL
jgi:hypothetical protein